MTFIYNQSKKAFLHSKFPPLYLCSESKKTLGIPLSPSHGSRLIVSRVPFEGATQVTINSNNADFIIKKRVFSSSIGHCHIIARMIAGNEVLSLDKALKVIRSYPKSIRFYVKYEGVPILNLTIGKRYKLTKYGVSSDYIVAQVESFRYLFINLHNGNRLSNGPCDGAYDNLSSLRNDTLNMGYTIEPLSLFLIS